MAEVIPSDETESFLAPLAKRIEIPARSRQVFRELRFKELSIQGKTLRASFALVDQETGQEHPELRSIEIGNYRKTGPVLRDAIRTMIDKLADRVLE